MVKFTLDQALDEIAYRCFRDMADQDYILARVSYKLNLPTNFNWCSLQAIEKYLKCILLLHRIEAKKINHNLEEALEKIKSIKISGSSSPIEFQDSSVGFIKEINNRGQSRYLGKSIYAIPSDITKLDNCIFDVRRFAIKIIDDTYLEKIRDSKLTLFSDFCLDSGFLEAVISGNQPAKDDLIFNNSNYGNSGLNRGFSAQNMPASYMGMSNDEYLVLYEKLNTLIKVDNFKEIINQLKNNN
ncbi:TPA: hypothetical protein I8010_001661 [Legionella pneumophila]|uniref:hypothetical protein n=1 Tax=Legionella pneumophila TaxID=446 RepID=UPI001A269CE1|nr:hypothetical protein [Legionella pneumophila]MCH9103660.1 hypothetical protein [Legionella pneumophila serogroup 1]HAT1991297.1 hypothetical protein [Legionella pneumophila]HAT1993833.1 hypothetical protein [Legionella pneumophila]HAT2051480.1 hypothetical protein [Legionella pneumophila]HAT2060881.1 hypothetical protein [Legionella pneumophila]